MESSNNAKSALAKLGKKNAQDVTAEEWKRVLNDMEYKVTREAATEPPFTGKFEKHFANGIYSCLCCGAQLFKSEAKFDSGCGWPAFSKSVDNDLNIVRLKDTSLFMERVEVRCKQCNAHLGHVFEDGPPETGERYCINSCSIDFGKKDGKSD